MEADPLLYRYLDAVGLGGSAADGGEVELRRGQFHDVLLSGAIAYRFPRDERSRRLLAGRVALLRSLGAHRPPVAIAQVVSDEAIDQPLGRCHVALQRVPGQPIEADEVTDAEAASVAIDDFARLLDWLEALGPDKTVRALVPPADGGLGGQFAADVREVLFPLMSQTGRDRAAAELERVLKVEAAGDALVHGDLGGENLLWDTSRPRPVLASVLDWDGAHLGNQAEDLASVAATFGWPLAVRLNERRHAGDAAAIDDARAITATFALQQALPAALSGDDAALDDGLLRCRDPR